MVENWGRHTKHLIQVLGYKQIVRDAFTMDHQLSVAGGSRFAAIGMGQVRAGCLFYKNKHKYECHEHMSFNFTSICIVICIYNFHTTVVLVLAVLDNNSFCNNISTFRLNGKQRVFSGLGVAVNTKSGVNVSAGPNTFNCRKQSVSIISCCHGIDTLPVLNLL